MEALYWATKGGGIFLGIRGKQLVLSTVAILAALLLLLAWEGTPIPAAMLPQALAGSSLPVYLRSIGYSNFSSFAVSDERELKEPAEIIDQDDALTGDSTLEDIRVVDSTVEEVSSDSKSVEESVTEVLNNEDQSGKDGGTIAGGGVGKTPEAKNNASEGVEEVVDAESKKDGDNSAGTQVEAARKGTAVKGTVVWIPEDTSLQDGDREGTEGDRGVAIQKAPGNPPLCDFTSGRWVEDDSRPPYSGEACYKKGWLSFMWACKIYERPDFHYEKYRWQPDKCDLPAFNAEEFLNRMKNQVLGFVGDSLGRQQFQSLMCLLTGGGEARTPEDVGPEFGFINPKHGKPTGWAYRFQPSNTTVLFHWSVCLCELEPIPDDPEKHSKMHLDRPAAFLRDYFTKLDSLVINTGHHWNRGKIDGNKWIMYRDGKPLSSTSRRFTVGNAYNFTAHAVAHWLHEQMEKTGKTRVYMRTLSPRHFMNGDWDTGGTCDNMKGTLGLKDVEKRPTRDFVAEGAILNTNLRLLNITYLSQFRGESHVSKYGSNKKFQDCLHWCLPGVPDVWNEVLSAELFQEGHN